MDSIRQFGKTPAIQHSLYLIGMLLGWLIGAPIALGMANEVTTTVLTQDEATEYIAEKTLRTALMRLSCYQFAEKHQLPKGEGRTFQLTRYEHVALPQNPITQGVTPGNTAMTISRVQAIAEQWGAVITMYDVPLLTIAHPVLQKAVDRLSAQAAGVIERECQRALMGVTNAQFANGKASRDLLIQTDVLTSLEVRRAVTNLRKNGAEKWTRTSSNTTKGYIDRMYPEGGGTQVAKPGMEAGANGLIGIVDTDVAQDLGSDATFVNASSYSAIRALYVNELGQWLGVVWIESNFMPAVSLLTSPTVANATLSAVTGVTATDYDVVVTRVRLAYGLEEAVSAKIDVTVSNNGISVALPAGATYGYRIYVGADAGTKYLVPTAMSATAGTADDLIGPVFAANQTVYITAIPTSGDTSPVAPASGVTVHVCWIFGMEAFGAVELSALEATLTPNQASDSDPLKQRRKAGWKCMFKCVVQNHNFIRKVECGSNFAG